MEENEQNTNPIASLKPTPLPQTNQLQHFDQNSPHSESGQLPQFHRHNPLYTLVYLDSCASTLTTRTKKQFVCFGQCSLFLSYCSQFLPILLVLKIKNSSQCVYCCSKFKFASGNQSSRMR